jgi:ribosomal protein L32
MAPDKTTKQKKAQKQSTKQMQTEALPKAHTLHLSMIKFD